MRAELDFGLCEAGGSKLKIPECPNAQGELEGSDETLMFAKIRIFKGAELLLSQQFEFSGETEIKPIQVDQDAKLEYLEVDHRYRTQVELGGSSQAFGPISFKMTYHGSTRVIFPDGSYDPTHTDVEVKFDIAGAQADELHEVRDVEFDESLKAKPEADKNFAAEVDRVIARAREKRRGGRCRTGRRNQVRAGLRHTETETRTERLPQSPGRLEERRLAQRRQMDAPRRAERDPRAGESPRQPGELHLHRHQSRQRRGRQSDVQGGLADGCRRSQLDPADGQLRTAAAEIRRTDLGDGRLRRKRARERQLAVGELERQRSPAAGSAVRIPGFPTTAYNYKLTSGSIQYGYSGEIDDCHVQGSQPIDLGAQFDLTNTVSMTLFREAENSSQLTLPMPLFTTVLGQQTGCEDPEENGKDFEWTLGRNWGRAFSYGTSRPGDNATAS